MRNKVGVTSIKTKRDTHVYTLRHKRKVVYFGITRDPENRLKAHQRSGKIFTSASFSAKCTRKSALKREKEAIKRYKDNHGRMPKYNKIL